MWPFRKTFHSDIQLHGVTVVITGGNAGIGKEIVKDLYKRGARILILCRDQEKSKATIDELKRDIETEHGELIMKSLDLSSLASVRACAIEVLREEQKIDCLINNADYYLGAKIYFNDLNLTNNFNSLRAYNQSKLAQIMFTKELAKRLQEFQINDVTTYSVHPGVVHSNIGQHLDSCIPGTTWLWNKITKLFAITPAKGARTTLYCALDKNLTSKSGGYFEDCSEARPASAALNQAKCTKLWDVTMELLKLKDPFDKNY